MPISKDDFRAALGRFVSGVTVVTARGDDDRPVGMTVSAFASVSLEPPLILACIDKRASVHGRFSEGSYFAVNILSEDQEHLSRRFASKDQDRFNGTRYTESVTGPPLLEGALAYLECRVFERSAAVYGDLRQPDHRPCGRSRRPKNAVNGSRPF